MNQVFYVVLAPDGTIQRTGACASDDLALQGPWVLAFEVDPQVSDGTHRYDPAAQGFVALL